MENDAAVTQAAQDFYSKAKEAYDRNNLDYAQTLLINVLTAHPDFYQARSLLRIAQLKKTEGDKPSIIKSYITNALLSVQYLKLLISTWKRQWLKGIDTLEEILKKDPANSFALVKLAEFALELNWTQTAIETLEVHKKIYSSNPETLKKLGKLYMKEEDLEKSRKYFEEALRLSPGDPVSLKGLKDLAAMKTIEQGGWNNTESYRDKIRDEKQADLLEKASRLVKSKDDLALLIKDLEGKKNDLEDNSAVLQQLAQLYVQNNQQDLAIKTYEMLLALLPFDENIQSELNSLKENKLNEDLAKTKQALLKNPSDPQLILHHKSLEHTQKGLALANTKKRVERYPNNLEYRYELGLLYFDVKDFNQAIQEFQHSVKDPQRRNRSLYYLGSCFIESGFYDLAEKQFLKVLEELLDMDSFKKEVIYHLGLVYEMMGQLQKATVEYKKIFEVDIGYKDIAEKIRKTYQK